MYILKSTVITILIMFMIGVNGYTQDFWEWSDPEPLTDSLSDNSNPFLYLRYWNGEKLYMVWEKHIDSVSSSIYMDNILDVEPAQEILFANGVQYTNPKIIEADYYPNCDSVFFLLYETNENGNIDIYLKAFLTNGSFLPAEPLVHTQYDELQLTVGAEDFYWDGSGYVMDAVMYIRNDSLFAINLMKDGLNLYFDEDTLIDTPVCSDPTIIGYGGNMKLIYLKTDTGEFHIYESVCNNYGNWSAPEVVYDSADCRNLSSSLHFSSLVWSAYKDTSWRILAKEPWGPDIRLYDISKNTSFDPGALGFVLGVKAWWPEVWIATPFPDNDTNEIFMTIGPGSPDFENFSNGGEDNRNSQFFIGEYYDGCFYDYLVWESHRNGHWQIWASKVLQCPGFVDENENNESFLSIHPNPFSNETTLEFNLETPSSLIIEVYDNRAMQVVTIVNRRFDQGEHQLRWDGSGLAAGVYVVKMAVGDRIYTGKVIKTR
jgi:hypothetical protein